ncbi:MAG: hypothetical protein AB8H86_07060 [Polyangiales bacterium]
MPRVVQPVPLTALTSWPTKRLMGLRKRLLRCEESLALSDVCDLAEIDPALIRFKEDPRWRALYEATLAVLATRENVVSGVEQQERRRERARVARRDGKPPPRHGGRG